MKYQEILRHWEKENEAELEAIQAWIDEFEIDDAGTPKDLAFQLTAYEQWGCIDFKKYLENQITNKLHNLDDDKLVALHNQACVEQNRMYDYIYTDLDAMFCGAVEDKGVEWIINRAHFGSYRGGSCGYFQFDSYGNIKEDYPSYLIDEDICAEALAKELPQLDEEALEILKRMDIELVNNGY